MKEKYVLIKKILNKNNDIISNDTTVSCCDNILCTSSCSLLDEECDEEEINKYDDFLKGTSRLSSLLKSPYFSSISSYRPCKELSNNTSFDLSSHKLSFDLSSHKSSYDLSSHKSSFDLSSHKSSFDLSSHKSSFDLSSHKSSFDLSSHKSSFSSSSCPPLSAFSYASSVNLSSRKERKKCDIKAHGSLNKKWSCNKNDDKDMWIHRMNSHKHPNHIVKKKKYDYNKEHKSAYCKNSDDINDEEYLKRMTKNIENYIRKMKDMIYYKRKIKKTKKSKEKKRRKKIKKSVNIKSICNDNNIKEYDNMNYNYINYKDHVNYENNNINDYNIHHYKKDIQKLYEHLNYEQNNLSTSLLENHYINKNETDNNLFWTCYSEENVEKPREIVFQKNCDLKKKSNELFITHTQNTFPYNTNLSCICCARIYFIDKIIKVTSNKIKPLCICCFDILLNLIGINAAICISCFKCYFPFEFVNKCVICNSFDMINLKKEDKRNMNIVKKELHIFMELYKYKFSDHFNSDIFLNYFINMNYCFKYLYYYFTIHQQIVISNNFVLARYTFPFSQLLQIIQKDKHKNKMNMNMEKNMKNEFYNDKHEFDHEEKYKNEIQLKIVNKKENNHVINHMNSHLSDHVNNNIKDNLNHNKCVNTQNELHDEYTNKVNEYYQIKNFEDKNQKQIGQQIFEELSSIQNKDVQEEYNIIQEIKKDILIGERNNKKENYIMKNVETNKEKEQIIKEKEMKHIENDTIIKDDKVVEKEVADKINVVNVKDIVDEINVVKVKNIVDKINNLDDKHIGNEINILNNPNKNDKENNINLNTVHINNKKKEDKKEDKKEEICSEKRNKYISMEEKRNKDISMEEKRNKDISIVEKRNKDISIVEKKNKDIFNKRKSINIRNELYKNKDKGNSKDSVENFFYTFSKTIISHIEKLKNKKIKFSFNEFKNTHIKLNELNFNNTIRKYYANGDLILYYIKYLQRQEKEIHKLYENYKKTENDVEHFKRRFRIHYGKEANEYDLNKNIYLKFRLLNKVQLLLEQKIKNFDNIPKNMEVYKIINEFGELIEEVSLQNNTYEKNNNILINYYLKNNIFGNDKFLLRQKKKRNISINKLNENYELLKENINSVLNILLFLYDTFNKNKNLNQLDLFHILKKIKMFLYDKEIKRLYNHFNDDEYNHNKNNKTTKSNEITKWKEKNVEICDNMLSRNDIRPEIICILNIRKKNMNNFLINNNKVQIINKNCLQLFNEPYNFDFIYINNIYFKHFISNKIINKYIHNFVNKNNVVLFNFSINYLKNKKNISFFNSFHDYFMNVDKTKINTFIKHQLQKKNGEKKNFIKNNEENHQYINEYKINSVQHINKCSQKCMNRKKKKKKKYSDKKGKNILSSKNKKSQEKNIKYKKKTLFKKIINELNNKLNQKYSNEKYNLTLNIYAQKKKKIYNINKCLFRNETNLYYQKNDIHKKEHKVEIMLINNYDNNTNHKINEKKIIQKEDMNKCKENEDSFQDRKNNVYNKNNIDHTYYDEDKTNPFLPSYGMDIKNIKNINKYINFNNMNKFKKSSIIFLIQLELFLTSDENINIPKKKILHFTLVDINIPILYILKKKNHVNYLNEFKKKQNFDNIFINYIQSYFFNTNVNHYSHNIITHLFQKNPYICFLLYIHDDFIFTNNSEYNKLHQIHNVKKENYSRNMILQLLYIYYMCNICECFNFIKQHC
ncbi:hypothetical protein PRSY57_1431500 [Plasmodium reichenowi]|uniref:Uncharacterized protein n=1 Tax=Plasmodium reichenowi TaxID=5854 RepID=A0A151L4T6_PLARE|nr:hypothetical protein PRSY57_1431500 [Plasmodium reichenowi]KYN93975.1 hypothetical protein PRSY57_1431500 [Plasmodium reichenowi]